MDKSHKLPGASNGHAPAITWTDSQTGDTYEVSFVDNGLEVVMPGGFPVVLPAGLIRHFLSQHIHTLLLKAAESSSPETIEGLLEMASGITAP